jgi:3-hydroxyisobutyrate dehydrogenase
MNAYCPAPGVGPQSPADNNIPGFSADLMLKDLRLSQKVAEAANANTPLGQHATDLYQKFVEEKNGSGIDFSAILQQLEEPGRG